MKLYFVGGYDKERLLCVPKTVKESNQAVIKFIKDHNYKSYYTRVWWTSHDGGTLHYDVGCHSQFFELREIPRDEAMKGVKE